MNDRRAYTTAVTLGDLVAVTYLRQRICRACTPAQRAEGARRREFGVAGAPPWGSGAMTTPRACAQGCLPGTDR